MIVDGYVECILIFRRWLVGGFGIYIMVEVNVFVGYISINCKEKYEVN